MVAPHVNFFDPQRGSQKLSGWGGNQPFLVAKLSFGPRASA
jgi:hypothetical protein